MELADIGKSYRRLDYETKVTGRAQYLADMSVPGMLHGKILRSPYPHAWITRIDATKAEKVPGVMAVLTRDDILHDQGIEPADLPVYPRARPKRLQPHPQTHEPRLHRRGIP
jgi:CO/xanthine dehydrogenase Mo-binding subunit